MLMNTFYSYKKYSALTRYLFAIGIFLIALELRFIILPVEYGFAFLTFYPAMVTCFYIYGTGAGILMALLSAIAVYYFFTPPFFSFTHKLNGDIAIISFFMSAVLIGFIIRRLHFYSEQLQISYQECRGILEDQTEIVCRFKSDGTMLYVNMAYCRIFGMPREKIIGSKWHPVVFPEDIDYVENQVKTLTVQNPIVIIENRIFVADGSVRWGQFVNRAFFDKRGNILEIQAVGRDITERKQLEQEHDQLVHEQQLMLDNDLIGILKTTKDRQIIWANKAMYRLFGYEENEFIGKSTQFLYLCESDYQNLGNNAYTRISSGSIYRTELEMRKKGGSKIWINLNGMLLTENGSELLWMMADITDTKLRQKEIEHIAYHDTLTGLPNRILFSDRLNQSLARAKRAENMLAVCYLDLDGFKPVNDKFGHSSGDKLLVEIADRLLSSIREEDTAARLGGDEFALILNDLETIEDYHAVLQRVIDSINRPIALDESGQVKVGASIGMTFYPHDSSDPDILLRHADQAMYRAKQLGRNQVFIFEP